MPCSPEPLHLVPWRKRLASVPPLEKIRTLFLDPEAEEALTKLKSLLTNPPVLVPPTKGEALLLYVAAMTQVVSTAVVVERHEEGHALPVQ